jgi:hypothetical protein
MFTDADFAHLRFLEGRWVGKGPDGSDFYEEYSFPNGTEMRSNRYPDATFTTSTDGSVVALHDGQVMSTWKEFTWKASALVPGNACFAPVNAPSSFCWERVSNSEVHVTQRWSDEKGAPHEYVVPLRRL